jgi:superfamily II DNA or RNA helicase
MDNTKDKIQEKAVELFNFYNILLSWATGCGKSLAAIKCIEKDIKDNNTKWYIVCWETTHIDNWIKEFKSYGKEYLLENIEIFCYASLHKYTENRNIVLDEAHHITDLSLEHLKKIKFSKLVLLSATVPDEKKKLLYSLAPFKEYNIPLEQAIEKGIIPPPKVYLVDVFLDSINKNQSFIIEKGNKKDRVEVECEYKDRFKYLKEHKDLRLKVNCTQLEKYTYLSEQVEYYKKQHFTLRAQWTQFKWLNAGGERKKFIAECKTEKAKEIINIIKDKRYICFTGTTEQCKTLGGKSVISSSTKKTNDPRIERFNKGKLNNLYAIKMLREGINLYNIQAGLIVQLDNQEKSFTQMLGRVFRSDYPVMFILVLRQTQDETYLTTSLTGFNSKYLLRYDKQEAKDIFN